MPDDGVRLETKVSSIEGRFKTVEDPGDPRRLLVDGLRLPGLGILMPSVEVRYRRWYYEVGGVRLTVDRDLAYRGAGSRSCRRVRDPEIAVEVKAGAGHPVSDLWDRFPVDRERFTKYGRAVEAALFGRPVLRD